MKKIIFILSSIFVFATLNFSIIQKEKLKVNGETVLLKLAPVDPRSLMQGDYMRLRYEIGQNQDIQETKKRGYLVIMLDENNIGSFIRLHQGEELASYEKLLHFHKRYSELRIVPDSFMFQEGHAEFYEQAKYGVFKFDTKGNHILIGLADAQMQLIQPS